MTLIKVIRMTVCNSHHRKTITHHWSFLSWRSSFRLSVNFDRIVGPIQSIQAALITCRSLSIGQKTRIIRGLTLMSLLVMLQRDVGQSWMGGCWYKIYFLAQLEERSFRVIKVNQLLVTFVSIHSSASDPQLCRLNPDSLIPKWPLVVARIRLT